MQATTEQVQRLMKIALIAAGNGLDADAETIFQGIQAVRPQSELPLVGRGVVEISRGRFPESVRMLQEALDKNPESDLALCFLGAALKLSGHNQAAQEAFDQLTQAGQDASAIELATAMTQNPA